MHPSTLVVDLKCLARYPSAYYHVLNDCVLPKVCTISWLGEHNATACYSYAQAPWVNLLAPSSKQCSFFVYWLGKKKRMERSCNIDRTLKSMLPTRILSGSRVVLLQRSASTRSFDPRTLSSLIAALESIGPVTVFTGRESPWETAAIFQDARYVVGYHGAGLANLFFSNNGTRVLEVTTFLDLESTWTWRSNMPEVTRYGQFKTRVLRIPLQQLLSANHASYTSSDTDHFIKDLKWVSLTAHDVREIVDFGRETVVENNDHRLQTPLFATRNASSKLKLPQRQMFKN